MPTEYTNDTKLPGPLISVPENQTIMHPRLLGQSARESFTDQSNPIIRTARIFPGITASEMQKVMDSMETLGGGIVHMGAGTYIVNGNIIIPDNVTLEGEGKDVTIIDFNQGEYALKITGAGGAIFPSSFTVNARIRDLTIQNSFASVACDITAAAAFTIDNVRFYDNNGIGLRIRGAIQYTVFNTVAEDNADDGFQLVSFGSTPHQEWRLIGCVANDNAGNGFYIASDGIAGQETKGGALIACQATGSDNGVDLRAEQIKVANGQFVSNALGVRMTGTENIIIGNVFSANSSAAVYNDGTDNLIRSNIGATDSP